MPSPAKHVACLTRVRACDGAPLNFTTDDLPSPRSRRCRTTFVAAEHVPAFEGDQAWFEMELVRGQPWSHWRAVRQVEPPLGWTPRVSKPAHPARLLGPHR